MRKHYKDDFLKYSNYAVLKRKKNSQILKEKLLEYISQSEFIPLNKTPSTIEEEKNELATFLGSMFYPKDMIDPQ